MTEIKAIFYPVSELSSVLVEIHQGNKTFFISENDMPISYPNMEIAKKVALDHGATTAFVALDKTYQEVDFVNDENKPSSASRHDYLPIPLKSE